MADERKHEEPLPNLDPTVELVERESLLDKISEKPSSPSSLKSKVYRLFGRERPVHKNKKVSGGATVSWVLFELIEYHLLALLCHLMIVSLAALFLWSYVTMFLSAILGLWILSILGGCCSFLTLAYIALVLLFTVPLIYDKYEDKVDSYGEKAMADLKKQYAVLDAKMLSKIPRGPLKNKKKV
ncbi:hypothetical protein HID58_086933 [Brassica napus]|uniref:Reticulon-like protein n=1 Tax=Brassica napus TaxID=3708 RepID=A0ABQ7XTP5_BRANA|nr:hypothetical protein HID58_086933 [Brassica napus]